MVQSLQVVRLSPQADAAHCVAVILPCYRVSRFILQVLAELGPEVQRIYVVDDACPEQSGRLVQRTCADPRVRVLFHRDNRGVGAATVTGYRQALCDGAHVLVKMDGDGQMSAQDLPRLLRPILSGAADYAKGNRFFHLNDLHSMPPLRMFGNAALAFLSKLSTGYWDLMDPVNGFTALHAQVAREVLAQPLCPRYFFESDMLFRLGTLRAVVQDVPMAARYGDEVSSLRIWRSVPEFLRRHLGNLVKRLFYNYLLRNITVATLEAVAAAGLLVGGGSFGAWHWMEASTTGVPTPTGTIMLAALPILVGVQLGVAAISYDIQNIPRQPLQHRL